MAVEDRRDGEGDPSLRASDGSATRGEREPRGDASRASARTGEGGKRRRKGAGGPKTAAGKAVVARNPIKHGVLAQTPVIPLIEKEEDWVRLRQGVFDFFELEGPLLESLGDRVAMIIWRLYRVARFETETIRLYLEDVPHDWYASLRIEGRTVPDGPSKADVEEMNRMLLSRLLPGDETMEKVMRYETRLHRFLLQTMYLIMVMKGLKKTRISRFWGLPDLNSPEISAQMGMPPSPGS